MIKLFRFLLVVLSLFHPIRSIAQTAKDSLFSVLKRKDSLLFNAGFNNCNSSIFEGLLSDNFEFYHDEAGVTLSKAKFIADFKQNVCGLSYKAKRVLDPASLQVYPLYRNGILYGAVQTGTHSFFGTEKNKSEHLTSVAKFTHIWSLENSDWKLKRAISYDHGEKAIRLILKMRPS